MSQSRSVDAPAVRLAMIGAGVIGRTHLAAISGDRGCALVAIADPAPAAGALAADCGVPCFADFARMLAETRPDGVLVCTPTEHHPAPTIAALEAGAHVLVEKPIAATGSEARAMVKAAKDAGRHLLVGHHRRYNPLLGKAREIIASGVIGHLVLVSGQWTLRKHDAYFEAEWRKRRAAGPVLTNLTHEIDAIRYICGEIRSVSAELSNSVRGFDKEDAAVLAMTFQSGAIGTISISDSAVSPWAWEFATGENPVFPTSGQNTHRFAGTLGALEFPNLAVWRHTGDAEGWRDPIERTPVAVDSGDAYARQIAHFAEVVRGEAEPLVTGVDGAQTLAATLAVFEAAETGRRIVL